MSNVDRRSVAELKVLAKEHGIDLEQGLKKNEILAVLEEKGANVITAPQRESNYESSVTSNPTGVTISPQPEHRRNKTIIPEPDPKTDPDKVAVYADRNLYWQNVGRLEKGYNFISKEAAGKWSTHRAVRSASPEEVAEYYGVN